MRVGVPSSCAGYVEMATTIYATLKQLIEDMGWPAYRPASPAQLQASLPRPEQLGRYGQLLGGLAVTEM